MLLHLFLPSQFNRIVYDQAERKFMAYAKNIDGELVCFGNCDVGFEVNPTSFYTDPVVADWVQKVWAYLERNTYRNIPIKPLANPMN